MNNPPLNASKGDTAPQNYLVFIVPNNCPAWESVYPFQHEPTTEDITAAITANGKTPENYTWSILSSKTTME
jgi:hypothetical protein